MGKENTISLTEAAQNSKQAPAFWRLACLVDANYSNGKDNNLALDIYEHLVGAGGKVSEGKVEEFGVILGGREGVMQVTGLGVRCFKNTILVRFCRRWVEDGKVVEEVCWGEELNADGSCSPQKYPRNANGNRVPWGEDGKKGWGSGDFGRNGSVTLVPVENEIRKTLYE